MTEIILYGEIGEGENTLQSITRDLKGAKDVTVRIHSQGGSVFEGVSIHDALKNHNGKVTVQIDGIAASIASIIALAGDHIRIAANGHLYLHSPHCAADGYSKDLRKTAEDLDRLQGTLVRIYASRSKQSPALIDQMLADDTNSH
jgi:ATP-dependent protease ClpP protease subunit